MGTGETIKSRYGLNQHIEYAGVCIAIENKLIPYLKSVEHCTGRHTLAKLHNHKQKLEIIGVYAPHALRDIEHKTDFYHKLGELYNKHKSAEPIILGDFNARLYHRCSDDPESFGEHFVQYEETTINNMAVGSKENRDCF